MAKKAKRKKKPIEGPPTVDSIVKECEKEVRRGLGKKTLSKTARDYWDTNHRASIQANLQAGADWLTDREMTLKVSRKLGKIAAILTNSNRVQLWAAKAAHVAVKADPICPAPGSGGYCDF